MSWGQDRLPPPGNNKYVRGDARSGRSPRGSGATRSGVGRCRPDRDRPRLPSCGIIMEIRNLQVMRHHSPPALKHIDPKESSQSSNGFQTSKTHKRKLTRRLICRTQLHTQYMCAYSFLVLENSFPVLLGSGCRLCVSYSCYAERESQIVLAGPCSTPKKSLIKFKSDFHEPQLLDLCVLVFSLSHQR